MGMLLVSSVDHKMFEQSSRGRAAWEKCSRKFILPTSNYTCTLVEAIEACCCPQFIYAVTWSLSNLEPARACCRVWRTSLAPHAS